MFTIPNEADAAFAAQAAPDKVDVDILVAGHERTGVVGTGCRVTAQATPDMTLAVAAGTIAVAGVQAAVTAGNVTITAAHATNPRFDLVVVSSTGVKSVTAGTAAAVPVFPPIPASSVVLAAVYVPAADAAIQSNQIVDKRVPTGGIGAFKRTAYRGAANITTTSTVYVDIDATNVPALSLTLAVGDVVELMLQAPWKHSASGNLILVDWLVDQPVAADTNLRGAAASWGTVELGGSATDINTRPIVGSFTATEAGVHTFKPQWRTNAGTASVNFVDTWNGWLLHTVKNLGAQAA